MAQKEEKDILAKRANQVLLRNEGTRGEANNWSQQLDIGQRALEKMIMAPAHTFCDTLRLYEDKVTF